MHTGLAAGINWMIKGHRKNNVRMGCKGCWIIKKGKEYY